MNFMKVRCFDVIQINACINLHPFHKYQVLLKCYTHGFIASSNGPVWYKSSREVSYKYISLHQNSKGDILMYFFNISLLFSVTTYEALLVFHLIFTNFKLLTLRFFYVFERGVNIQRV